MRDNFSFLKSIQHDQSELVSDLEEWTRNKFEQQLPVFYQRIEQGMIRECQGDLHLGNVFFEESGFTLFDRIEFSESLSDAELVRSITIDTTHCFDAVQARDQIQDLLKFDT